MSNTNEGIDQELEYAAEKAYPNCYTEYDEGRAYRGFVKGATWQKEQSATDAIEFAEWLWRYGREYQRGGTYVVDYPEGNTNVYFIYELYALFKNRNK